MVMVTQTKYSQQSKSLLLNKFWWMFVCVSAHWLTHTCMHVRGREWEHEMIRTERESYRKKTHIITSVIYICLHICVCVCVCVCASYIHTHTHTHTHTRKKDKLFLYRSPKFFTLHPASWVCVHVHACVCAYICVCVESDIYRATSSGVL